MVMYKLFLLIPILFKTEILVFGHTDSAMLSESILTSGGIEWKVHEGMGSDCWRNGYKYEKLEPYPVDWERHTLSDCKLKCAQNPQCEAILMKDPTNYVCYMIKKINNIFKECTWGHSNTYNVFEKKESGKILNPVVLLTGGLIGEGTVDDSVEVFSPWENISCRRDLENLRYHNTGHTMNIFRNQIIMCGGFLEEKRCFSLDENQRFVPHSQLNNTHGLHTAAVISDKLLVVGGLKFVFSTSLESWDGHQWIVEEDDIEEKIDSQFGSCIAAISEDTFLMSGGIKLEGRNGIRTNNMVKYKNGVWEQMEDFPGPGRRGHGCAFIETPEGGAFLIAGGGGHGDENDLDSSYLYNIEKRVWKKVGKLNFARFDAKILVVNGRPIIVGGGALSDSGSDVPKMMVDVEEFNLETKQWTVIQKKINRGKVGFGAVVIPGAAVGCSYIA